MLSTNTRDREELEERVKFLEEVLLVALYGNWFIALLDYLNFPFTENMPLWDRILLCCEGLAVMLLITTLFFYFLKRRQRSSRLWFFHLALLLLTVVIDMKLDPSSFSLKRGTFIYTGILFWVLIQWIDYIRERFRL